MSTFESAKKARKNLTGIEPILLQLFTNRGGRYVAYHCTMAIKVQEH